MDNDTKILNNAHKITYLVKCYPEKPMKDIRDEKGQVKESGLFSLLALPAIDINLAIWYAQDQGWIGEPDIKTDLIPLLSVPDKWEFGEFQKNFQDTIIRAFKRLGNNQRDLEEFVINQWLGGYPVHDVFVALKYLLETKQLAEYMIEDTEGNYIFYTLYENKDKLWGRKNFKVDPLNKSDAKKKK